MSKGARSFSSWKLNKHSTRLEFCAVSIFAMLQGPAVFADHIISQLRYLDVRSRDRFEPESHHHIEAPGLSEWDATLGGGHQYSSLDYWEGLWGGMGGHHQVTTGCYTNEYDATWQTVESFFFATFHVDETACYRLYECKDGNFDDASVESSVQLSGPGGDLYNDERFENGPQAPGNPFCFGVQHVRYLLLEPGDYTFTSRVRVVCEPPPEEFENNSGKGAAFFSLSPVPTPFISLTIHGQDPNGFNPFFQGQPTVPNWTGFGSVLRELAESPEVTEARRKSNFAEASATDMIGDWAALTWRGAPDILYSRVLDLASATLELRPLERLAMASLARLFEVAGRRQTSASSVAAAWKIATEVEKKVKEFRDLCKDSYVADCKTTSLPVFVDIFAHSRGGAVASEVSRILRDLPPPVAVSITFLDAIDPSPSDPDLPRPLARAGWLLGDPPVAGNQANRVSNFYAECALFYDCHSYPAYQGVDGGFFGQAFIEWLWEWFSQSLRDAGDSVIVNFGYPKGHERNELNPESNDPVPRQTHTNVPIEYSDSIGQIVIGQGAVTNLSPLRTSYIGQVLEDPTKPVLMPPSSDAISYARTFVAGVPLENFVADPLFLDSASMKEAIESIVISGDHKKLFLANLPGLVNVLEDSMGTHFPWGSAWSSDGTRASLGRSKEGTVYAQLDGSASLMQPLLKNSRFVSDFTIEAVIAFTDSHGVFRVDVKGDGLDATGNVSAADIGTATVFPFTIAGGRAACVERTALDQIRLRGSHVRIYSVSVSADEGHLGDADANGVVDAADYREFHKHFAGPSPAAGIDFCAFFDSNMSGSIDLGDFADFANRLSNCGDECVVSACGNGRVDARLGEQCDEANHDSCDEHCHWVVGCGDGTVEGEETCDPPDGDWCDAACQLVPGCGNGKLEPPEECDPPDGYLCTLSCSRVVCGDGRIEEYEECDPPDGTECLSNCRMPVCGDEVIEGSEECDPPDGVECDAQCSCIADVCYGRIEIEFGGKDRIVQAGSAYPLRLPFVHGASALQVFQNNAFVVSVAYFPDSPAGYKWDVCEAMGNGVNYEIRQYSFDEGRVAAVSKPFEIVGSALRPVVAITSPEMGAHVPRGSPLEVTWNTTNPYGQVNVWVYREESAYTYSGLALLGLVSMSARAVETPWAAPSDASIGLYAISIAPTSASACPGRAWQYFKVVTGKETFGDMDGDDDVDSIDAQKFVECEAGPQRLISTPCIFEDLNDNLKVDLTDFAILQNLYEGAGP